MSTKRLADRRQRRQQKAIFWALVLAFLGYGLFIGDHRPYHLGVLYLEEMRTEREIARLRQENLQLNSRHERLESDAFALESLAREKGMVRRGDVVYRIVPVPPDVAEAAAESLAARAESLAAQPDSIIATQQ